MKLLFILNLLFLVSCEILPQQEITPEMKLTNQLDRTEYFNEIEEFVIDAQKHSLSTEIEDFSSYNIYIENIENEVSCQENNIIIQDVKWNRINNFLNKPPMDRLQDILLVSQSRKALLYKSFALCVLKQSPRNTFNKYDNIVPVPSSLTYKFGVASSWLVNYCYYPNSIGIYPSLNECDNYYRESFWNAYLYELFYIDDKFVIDQAFRERIVSRYNILWRKM